MMQRTRGAVLLIDDEQFILSSMAMTLNMAGITEVERCQDSREAERLLSERQYSAVTLDVNMPYVSGKELLTLIAERFPEIQVVIITGTSDQQAAQEYLELGAFDYLVKPVDKLRLVLTIRHAIGWHQHMEAVRRLHRYLFEQCFSRPEALSALEAQEGSPGGMFECLRSMASSAGAVLVTGADVGLRERVARLVHRLSGVPGAFVPVGRLQDGAVLQQAEGGTLFVDDVGELRPEDQARLMRLVALGSYRPEGSEREVPCAARLVLGAGRDLQKAAQEGRFRRDLLHLLSSSWIPIPPSPAAG